MDARKDAHRMSTESMCMGPSKDTEKQNKGRRSQKPAVEQEWRSQPFSYEIQLPPAGSLDRNQLGTLSMNTGSEPELGFITEV